MSETNQPREFKVGDRVTLQGRIEILTVEGFYQGGDVICRMDGSPYSHQIRCKPKDLVLREPDPVPAVEPAEAVLKVGDYVATSLSPYTWKITEIYHTDKTAQCETVNVNGWQLRTFNLKDLLKTTGRNPESQPTAKEFKIGDHAIFAGSPELRYEIVGISDDGKTASVKWRGADGRLAGTDTLRVCDLMHAAESESIPMAEPVEDEETRAEEAVLFAVGDLVELRSGSPPMTVYEVIPQTERVKVKWWGKGEFQTATFSFKEIFLSPWDCQDTPEHPAGCQCDECLSPANDCCMTRCELEALGITSERLNVLLATENDYQRAWSALAEAFGPDDGLLREIDGKKWWEHFACVHTDLEADLDDGEAESKKLQEQVGGLEGENSVLNERVKKLTEIVAAQEEEAKKLKERLGDYASGHNRVEKYAASARKSLMVTLGLDDAPAVWNEWHGPLVAKIETLKNGTTGAVMVARDHLTYLEAVKNKAENARNCIEGLLKIKTRNLNEDWHDVLAEQIKALQGKADTYGRAQCLEGKVASLEKEAANAYNAVTDAIIGSDNPVCCAVQPQWWIGAAENVNAIRKKFEGQHKTIASLRELSSNQGSTIASLRVDAVTAHNTIASALGQESKQANSVSGRWWAWITEAANELACTVKDLRAGLDAQSKREINTAQQASPDRDLVNALCGFLNTDGSQVFNKVKGICNERAELLNDRQSTFAELFRAAFPLTEIPRVEPRLIRRLEYRIRSLVEKEQNDLRKKGTMSTEEAIVNIDLTDHDLTRRVERLEAMQAYPPQVVSYPEQDTAGGTLNAHFPEFESLDQRVKQVEDCLRSLGIEVVTDQGDYRWTSSKPMTDEDRARAMAKEFIDNAKSGTCLVMPVGPSWTFNGGATLKPLTPPKVEWEYLGVKCTYKETISEKCNELGKDSWELVSIERFPEHELCHLYFKRLKPAQRQ